MYTCIFRLYTSIQPVRNNTLILLINVIFKVMNMCKLRFSVCSMLSGSLLRYFLKSCL